MQLFVHRMNQTAHISLQIFKISKSVETKLTGCALFFLARPASNASGYFTTALPQYLPSARLMPPQRRSAPLVKGYLRL